jgi:glycosyltransferase involved in cell wall biosynthesis
VLQRLAARRILGRCQALFTHADVLKGTLQQKFPEIPTASHAIPPPPDFEVPDTAVSRSERDLPSEARIALFLGLIRPYKGVDLLLEAWHRLPAGCNWHLVVAGEPWGDQGKRLRRQVDRLGIGARVRLELRWIPEGEVGSWLAAADLVVLPYRSGSQSAVAPLALGAGRPVVASRVGGLPEVVHHGVNGLLVEPGSVDALARVFAELDDAQLAELTRGARDWRGTITWNSYASAIESLIKRVVGA